MDTLYDHYGKELSLQDIPAPPRGVIAGRLVLL